MRTYQAQTYSIGSVAKITGATKKQIRNWEAGGHIPKADRIQYGDRAYRRFSLKQVELISKIRELRDEGYTLPAAAETHRISDTQTAWWYYYNQTEAEITDRACLQRAICSRRIRRRACNAPYFSAG